MTDQSFNPHAHPEAVPERLERAIEALTGIRPGPTGGMTHHMRGGAGVGLLIGTAINAYYALATGVDEETSVDVHRSLVGALDMCADTMRLDVVHTLINIIMTWLNSGKMGDRVGPEDFHHAMMHLGAAFMHLDPSTEGESDSPGDDEDDEVGLTVDVHSVYGMDDVPFAPATVPSAVVDQLGEACSALGISPIIQVEGPDGDHQHPLMPVAVLAGVVTGRATMELSNMVASADEHLRGTAAPLWVSGFIRGVAPSLENPRDDVIAAAALRLVNIIGLWHENRPDAKYGAAIAAMCKGAGAAGRAAGIESGSVATQAEYIANYGDDASALARQALASAEAAVKALKDAGVTM